MNILITNIQLATRTGTEIVVRDLAQRFVERGHKVKVYSPTIGEFAEELTHQGIPVVNNLLTVEHPPDVIHGHHMPVTAEAIIAFPHTPAIWTCHDATSLFDKPPRFAQVRRIFAVDETCRTRLADLDRIPLDKVEILPNAIDLRRFTERTSALPKKPLRAISLVKHAGLADIIQRACGQSGITFEAYGHGVGRPVGNVEQLCATADIVFGTARTALEAMACGAAAVLVDGRGFGGLVTSQNYDHGRRFNFGVGVLKQETTLDRLIEAIAAYDAHDAALVGQRTRREADLELNVSRLEDVYRAVIAEAKVHPLLEPELFRRQQIEFYHSWLAGLDELRNHLAESNAQNQLLAKYVSAMEASKAVRFSKFVRRKLGLPS